MRFLPPVVSLLILSLSSAMAALPPLKTVEAVNLARYEGKWYEIALIPYFFERGCAQNAWVEYTRLPDGSFKDYFECEMENGKKKVAVGRAKVVDSATNAKLSATFLNLWGWRYWFGANYWIIGLGDAYDYTVVAHPSRRYGWLMARTPQVSLTQLRTMEALLQAQGYDTCRFKMFPNSPDTAGRPALCEFVKSK